MKNKKQEFFQKINEAFAEGNIDFILENVTDDIRWNLVGSLPVNGKNEFMKSLEGMREIKTKDFTITNIITHGYTAVADGTMEIADKFGVVKTYAFCDIYRLDKLRNGKIKEMTSYVIEIDKHI